MLQSSSYVFYTLQLVNNFDAAGTSHSVGLKSLSQATSFLNMILSHLCLHVMRLKRQLQALSSGAKSDQLRLQQRCDTCEIISCTVDFTKEKVCILFSD